MSCRPGRGPGPKRSERLDARSAPRTRSPRDMRDQRARGGRNRDDPVWIGRGRDVSNAIRRAPAAAGGAIAVSAPQRSERKDGIGVVGEVGIGPSPEHFSPAHGEIGTSGALASLGSIPPASASRSRCATPARYPCRPAHSSPRTGVGADNARNRRASAAPGPMRVIRPNAVRFMKGVRRFWLADQGRGPLQP